MLNNKSGFTIIEVLMATLILWLTVFWILKLTNNNSLQVNNLNKQADMSLIFWNTKECMKSIWYNYFNSTIWITWSINFWIDNNWCYTWSYDSSLSFSWINIKWQDEYWSYYITSTWWTNYLDVVNIVSDWWSENSYDFKMYK
ncbi:MAG: hypothetical protein ACD_4C00353G0002 [uncultured bacterium (gcode 4)]|uniref:Prepilin-type N-terminal cleavage/methylation domain-containing protein n=1 Tax=uncultured bacterium (gcode 4) TaxID=1234023 RepID=K2GSH6_9BACT|nr:MAG: hypothetical protein ACD_4C00353G0002 [uncultured bacterium (gcode 4)]